MEKKSKNNSKAKLMSSKAGAWISVASNNIRLVYEQIKVTRSTFKQNTP